MNSDAAQLLTWSTTARSGLAQHINLEAKYTEDTRRDTLTTMITFKKQSEIIPKQHEPFSVTLNGKSVGKVTQLQLEPSPPSPWHVVLVPPLTLYQSSPQPLPPLQSSTSIPCPCPHHHHHHHQGPHTCLRFLHLSLSKSHTRYTSSRDK